MEVEIVKHAKRTLKVMIACYEENEQVKKLKRHIELFDEKLQGKKGTEIVFVEIADVLYFETVDNRTFLYTAKDVIEIEQKLYELEMILSEKDFIRSSKSQIVHIHKIIRLKPELNRTIQATMCNGEKLYISRRYTKSVKNLLGI